MIFILKRNWYSNTCFIPNHGLQQYHREHKSESSLTPPTILCKSEVTQYCYVRTPVFNFILQEQESIDWMNNLPNTVCSDIGSNKPICDALSIFSCSTARHMPSVIKHKITYGESIPNLNACLALGVKLHSRWLAKTMCSNITSKFFLPKQLSVHCVSLSLCTVMQCCFTVYCVRSASESN